MSIKSQLVQLAKDEGKANAVAVAERYYETLEGLCEIGSPTEQIDLDRPLHAVSQALIEIHALV